MGTQSQETYDKVRELLQPLQNQGILLLLFCLMHKLEGDVVVMIVW
jgi:hypothetical protein